MRAQRWLVYALGGGMGHLTRASALARAATRRGHHVELVTNTSFAPGLPVESLLGPGGTVHRLDAGLDKRTVTEDVEQLLFSAPWDVLVVDTFPRGLVGELASLLPRVRAPKVLVHRDLNPEYVARFDLARAVEAFSLLLVPGEDAPFSSHPRAVRTAPWLLLDAEELRPRAEARRLLGAEDPARPLVVVSGCGREEEVDESGMTADRLRAALGGAAYVRWVLPPLGSSGPVVFPHVGAGTEPTRLDGHPHPVHLPEQAEGEGSFTQVWPLLALLPGVDVLVGAGGYNTVQECRATGTPLVALARSRLYDRQALRLRPEERVDTPEDVRARVEALLRALPARAPLGYVSGTHAAVDLIERAALSA